MKESGFGTLAAIAVISAVVASGIGIPVAVDSVGTSPDSPLHPVGTVGEKIKAALAGAEVAENDLRPSPAENEGSPPAAENELRPSPAGGENAPPVSENELVLAPASGENENAVPIVEDNWVPCVPNPNQVELRPGIVLSPAKSAVIAKITFSDLGYRVLEWGSVERVSDNRFVANAKPERYTGPSVEMVKELSHAYTFEAYPFEFTFKCWGEPVETVRIPPPIVVKGGE